MAIIDAAAQAHPVQRALALEPPGQESAARVRRHADAGLRGSVGRLPYADTIQRAFGHHDLGHVQAHTDASAAAACRSIDAKAYTVGSQIAFAGPPSLHTAAHEAAHTVQQGAGVRLAGGVGAAGDPHERHADAVADAVVRGGSAEALLDSYGGGSPTAEAPVQRKILTLGEMDDEPNLSDTKGLLARLPEALPDAFAQFLPVLAESDEEHIFAVDKTGALSVSEAKNVITNTDASFIARDGYCAFVAPDAPWQHADHILRTPGMIWAKQGERHVFGLNLRYLPQVTPGVVDAIGRLTIAERDPTRTMVLPTKLGYRSIARNRGQVAEYGLLGSVVVSVTPNLADEGSGTTVQTIKQWLIDTYAMWEPMQMDPRHIGTHDGYNMGVVWHYHLIMPPGTTLSAHDEQRILQEMQDRGAFGESVEARSRREKAEQRELAKQQMNPNEQAMRAFLAASLAKPDSTKQALVRRELTKSVDKGVTKFLAIEPGLTTWTRPG